MKSRIGWIIAIVLGLVVLFFLPVLFGYGCLGRQGYEMMGDYGMMYDMFPFGWLWMWIFPLLMLVCCVVWLVHALSGTCNWPKWWSNWPGAHCAHCGKPIQADWKTCPFCGKSLG